MQVHRPSRSGLLAQENPPRKAFFVTTLIPRNKKHVTSLRTSLGTLDPGLKMREHLCFCYCNFFTQLYSAIAVLAMCPPDSGLQKRANLSTLIVGLSGTEDQTQATWVAGSGDNRSAIHYDDKEGCFLFDLMPSSRGRYVKLP
jgi:hypothetical protein